MTRSVASSELRENSAVPFELISEVCSGTSQRAVGEVLRDGFGFVLTSAARNGLASWTNWSSLFTRGLRSSMTASSQPRRSLEQSSDHSPLLREAQAIRVDRARCAGSRWMCCWLTQSSFSVLKTALPPLIPSRAKRAMQLVAREQLLVAAG